MKSGETSDGVRQKHRVKVADVRDCREGTKIRIREGWTGEEEID